MSKNEENLSISTLAEALPGMAIEMASSCSAEERLQLMVDGINEINDTEFRFVRKGLTVELERKRVRVDVERVKELKAELLAINNLNLAHIDFYENGEKVTISDAAVERWQMLGLNNTDFVMGGLGEGTTVMTFTEPKK